jgi:outer membrane protein assembly factor BamB
VISLRSEALHPTHRDSQKNLRSYQAQQGPVTIRINKLKGTLIIDMAAPALSILLLVLLSCLCSECRAGWSTQQGNNQRTGQAEGNASMTTTGAILWSFVPPRPGGFRGAPIVDSTSTWVYAGDTKGWVYCVAAAGGQIRWELQINASIVATLALASNDILYVPAVDGRLVAVNATLGTVLWTIDAGVVTGAATSFRTAPLVSEDANMIYIGSTNGTVFSLDSLGGLRWQANGPEATASTTASLTAAGNVAIGIGAHLCLFDGWSGASLWAIGMNAPHSPATIALPALECVLVTYYQYAACFNASGGRLYWLADNPTRDASYQYGLAVSSQGVVYSESGGVGIGVINGTTGASIVDIHGFTPMAPIQSIPAVGADGILYFSTITQIVAYNVEQKSVRWTYPCPCGTWGRADNPFAFGADGTLFATFSCPGSANVTMIAFRSVPWASLPSATPSPSATTTRTPSASPSSSVTMSVSATPTLTPLNPITSGVWSTIRGDAQRSGQAIGPTTITTYQNVRYTLAITGPTQSYFTQETSMVLVGDATATYLVFCTTAGLLSAYDSRTTALVWSRPLQPNVGTPSVSSNGVIIVTDEDGISAYSRLGTLLWFVSAGVMSRVASTVTTKSGLVIGLTTGANTLSAWWTQNGTRAWQSSVYGAPVSALALSNDESLVIVATSGVLSAYSMATGAVQWEANTGSGSIDFCIGKDDIIYFYSGFYINAMTGTVYGSSASTQRWCAITPSGILYVADSSQYLYAYDTANSMKQLFYVYVGSSICAAPAIGADGTVYLVSVYNQFVQVTAWNGYTGVIQWKYVFPVRSAAPDGALSIGPDGTVYVRVDTYTSESHIVAFQPEQIRPTGTPTITPSITKTPSNTATTTARPTLHPALSTSATVGLGVGVPGVCLVALGAAAWFHRKTLFRRFGWQRLPDEGVPSDDTAQLLPGTTATGNAGTVALVGYGATGTHYVAPPSAPSLEQLYPDEFEDPDTLPKAGQHPEPKDSVMPESDPAGPR